ncbi:MAG: prephenate/arogenate dehydrogenase family protein [Pseudomonadota bacterium]
MADKQVYERVAIIGAGLIGSSLARAIRRAGAAGEIIAFDISPEVRKSALDLGFADAAPDSLQDAVTEADLVVIATPVGVISAVVEAIAPVLKPGATITDVGSVKAPVAALADHLFGEVYFVPGHPVAGTELSGPEAGFAELFDGRWCILTPFEYLDSDYEAAVERLSALWRACGAEVETMKPDHHDLALAVTSHIPHLLAFTLVGAADDLEAVTEGEIVKYAAGGFRDYTRIAASDPTMWRDIFLNNREAVLEVLGRFTEDMISLQSAIRRGEGDRLFDAFERARRLRAAVKAAGQS